MIPLAHEPRTFRELIESDLRRAARLIIKIQDELDWQFRIATPGGDIAIAVPMPVEDDPRHLMMRRLAKFMAWKQAIAFTLACEIFDPDAVFCAGISASESACCWARITRHPKPWTAANFSAPEWKTEAWIGSALYSLLPSDPRPRRPDEIIELQKWFGESGKFPAVRLQANGLELN